MTDGLHPTRPAQGFHGDAERAKRYIRNYAADRRLWVASAPPGAPGAATLVAEKEVIKEVIKEVPVKEFVALPDEEAYEAGFNDGLMEGKRLAGASPPPDWPQPFVPDETLPARDVLRREDGLKAQINSLEHDLHTLEQDLRARTAENNGLRDMLKARDAALVALRQDLVERMAKMEAVCRIQELESRTLQDDVTRLIAETRRKVTNIDKHPAWDTHTTNGAEVWGRRADKVLASVNLRIDGTEVKEAP